MTSTYTTRRKQRPSDRAKQWDALRRSEFSRSASGLPLFLQRKLAIRQPGDAFEQEADRVAAAVMSDASAPADLRSGEPGILRKCACGGSSSGKCKDCLEKRAEQLTAAPVIQRRASGGDTGMSEAPPIVDDALRSPGQPLDPSVRPLMETRFGHDFSDVRVHTDSVAEESANAVDALAYTTGNHIAFAANRYAPGTSAGRKLLAHELTHVLQQQSGTLARQAAPPTPQGVIADADTRRIGTLLFVLSELSDVISDVKAGLEPNPYTFTLAAIQNWLFVSPGDPNFLATVQAATDLYLRNLALTPRLLYQSNTVQVDSAGNACPPNFAYSRGGVGPIFFCDNFIAAGIGCQRDVMIHEHFHLLGLLLPGVQFPAGLAEPVAATTAQALGSPDSLAQMATEIAEGAHTPCCQSGC